MNIPDQKQNGEAHESSVNDAFFQYQSQLLLSNKKTSKAVAYKFGYKKSFEPISANNLLKKTLNTAWRERYFLLTSTRLLYYSDSTLKDLKGCFILASLIEYKLKVKFNQPQICFIVKVTEMPEGEKTLLQLMIEDDNVYKDWERSLTKVVARLEALKSQEICLFPRINQESLMETNFKLGGKSGNFWNNLVISTHELIKYGSHMDIILLRSKNPIFYLHRFFMRSYYDHVAVLIKDETERLFLFEAIQSKGVCISSLESLLTTFRDEYEELGYRKLLIENQTNFHIDHLEEYINSLLGSKYELSLSKLLLDNQAITLNEPAQGSPDELPSNEGTKQEKTYFCSELIADLYLKFDILAGGKSNNYWPKDFQQDEMTLTKGFKLSPLMRVQIDVPELSQSSQV